MSELVHHIPGSSNPRTIGQTFSQMVSNSISSTLSFAGWLEVLFLHNYDNLQVLAELEEELSMVQHAREIICYDKPII